jgi:hypothetical protein
MAFDPASGRFYWANYGNNEEQANAIGTVTLAEVTGGITPEAAPVDGPQDPLILKSPTGAGAPQVTQNGTALSCSQGSWSQDYPGSYVYGAPVSYSYQWLQNGQAITGATASIYRATATGSYSCMVTGTNVSGSASQTSGSVGVTVTPKAAAPAPAKLSLTLVTKKPHAKAGKVSVVKLRVSNGGATASTPTKVCAKLTKKAKKGLVAPKCASVGAVAAGGSAVATLKVKTKPKVKGTYKFTAQMQGVTPVPVSVKVTAAMKAGKKHHKK